MRKIQSSAEQTIITAHLSPGYLFCQKSLTINSREESFFGVCEKMASKEYNWRKENPMQADKRGLLKAFLGRQDLCQKLSADEIRVFLLLVVFAEERKSEGMLSWENVKKYLGDDFGKDRLKRAASTLEEMELANMDLSARETGIVFQLL